MTNNSTTTVEKIVALGGGFSEYRHATILDQTCTSTVLATLSEPVVIQYGRGARGPQDATIVSVEYRVQRSGTVQVVLHSTRVGGDINPEAVVAVEWRAKVD